MAAATTTLVTATTTTATTTTTTTFNNKRMGSLLEERLAPGSGTLCNDSNGLCLGYRGTIDASQSGIYTSLTKLAGLLDGRKYGTSNNHGSKGNEGGEAAVVASPVVSIQTDKATILMKEYGGGRTVVFRIPNNVVDNGETNMKSVVGESHESESYIVDDDNADVNEGGREFGFGSGEADNSKVGS